MFKSYHHHQHDAVFLMVRNVLRHVIEAAHVAFDRYEDAEAEVNESDEPAFLPDFLRVLRDNEDGEPVILPLRPLKEKSKLSLKLSELQRDAIIHATRLRRGLKNRLREAGSGPQVIEFTQKKFDELQSEVGEAAVYAPGPYKQRLTAVINKMVDAAEADLLERYEVEETGRPTPTQNTVYQLKVSLIPCGQEKSAEA